MTELTVVVLAAGEGTRMKSAMPKILHPVAGLPIICHVVDAAAGAKAQRIAVITGPGHQAVRDAIAARQPKVTFFEQTERRGTAHAAQMARPVWQDAKGHIAVVYGDHPLLRAENFALVTDRLDAGMDAAILGFEPLDPTGYGRFITDGERLLAIREHKDASEEERKIGLCNACILGFTAEAFRAQIDRVDANNAQGEFYIPDLVELINKAGGKVGYAIAPEEDVMGVNDRAQLARAEALYQEIRREDFMKAGVTLRDPATVYFSYDTEIGRDVVIEPNVVFGPGVTIGTGVQIRAFSHIEGARVDSGATIGPFARLRPEAHIAEGAHVGNFVEIKKAEIGKGAKVNHLTYIGDAIVGASSNIGAGTITCNYDGINKHLTEIGENVFVGSNSSLVAPIKLGDGAYIASGSVITEDVPENAVAFGRARQTNKDDYAPVVKARAQAIKDAKKKKLI